MVEKQLLSRAEAAEYLHIGVRTLDRLTASNKVSFVRIGGKVVFVTDDLDDFIERNRVEARIAVLPSLRSTYRTKRAPG